MKSNNPIFTTLTQKPVTVYEYSANYNCDTLLWSVTSVGEVLEIDPINLDNWDISGCSATYRETLGVFPEDPPFPTSCCVTMATGGCSDFQSLPLRCDHISDCGTREGTTVCKGATGIPNPPLTICGSQTFDVAPAPEGESPSTVTLYVNSDDTSDLVSVRINNVVAGSEANGVSVVNVPVGQATLTYDIIECYTNEAFCYPALICFGPGTSYQYAIDYEIWIYMSSPPLGSGDNTNNDLPADTDIDINFGV